MASKKILIADDDPAICTALQLLLEEEGYNVEVQDNGEDVKNLQGKFADVLLLDIWMSGTDGRDVARQLKRNSSTSTVPIIMISANQDVASSAMLSGADDYVAKPFDVTELLSKVRKYTGV